MRRILPISQPPLQIIIAQFLIENFFMEIIQKINSIYDLQKLIQEMMMK